MTVSRPRSMLVLGCLVLMAGGPHVSLAMEFRVNTYTTSGQRVPSVSVGPAGEFVVTWESEQDGSARGVFARRYDSTGVALDATEFQVNTYTFAEQLDSVVGFFPAGDFVIVWSSDSLDGSAQGIFARRYDSAGSALDGSEFQVNSYTTGPQRYPSVDVDAAGNFVVAWRSAGQDGDYYGVFARRFSSSGAALDAGDIQVNTFTTSAQRAPSVGVAPSGDFVVAWQSDGQDGDRNGVFARRFSSSGAALDANDFQVNTQTTGNQEYPSVGVGPAGDFVVAWQAYGQDGDSYGVFARRFASSGIALDANEFQVNTYTGKRQTFPSLDVDPAGDFVVSWTSDGQDGSYYGIFARRFASSGAALDTTDFQVNTYTINNQRLSSTAVGALGDFVVAWMSQGQDGSQYGVFAEQFCADSDGDGICDSEDILVTDPLSSGSVDCRTPGMKATRPLITWSKGNYDRFRVQISWDPAFTKGMRVTSGKTLLSGTQYRPGLKKWRKVCNNAGAEVFIRVFGVDRNVAKSDPNRKTFSDVVTPAVVR